MERNMGKIAEFFIPGNPRTAKKQKKDGLLDWEDHVKAELRRQWGKDPIEQDTRVQLDILFKIKIDSSDKPGSHGPDLDNLMKPVLDGIAEVMLPVDEENSNKNGDQLVYRLLLGR